MFGHGCASFSAAPEYEQIDEEKEEEDDDEDVLEDFPLEPEEETEYGGSELTESGEAGEEEGEGEGGGDEEGEGGEGGDFYDFSSYDESTQVCSLSSCPTPIAG